MSSIRRRPSGNWQATTPDPTDPRRRISRTFPTRSQARAWARGLEHATRADSAPSKE